MKSILMIFGLLIGLQAFAAGPVGTYYSSQQPLLNGGWQPESLWVFTDKKLVVSSVHNEAVIVRSYDIEIQNDQMTIVGVDFDMTYKCSGYDVTYIESKMTNPTAKFETAQGSVKLSMEGGESVLTTATADQINRIQNLTPCTKNL